MSGATYYRRNRETILNRADEYCVNNNKILRQKAKNKHRELSKEEKNIKKEYGKNRYHNLSDEKKQKLNKYQRNYREAKKHLT